MRPPLCGVSYPPVTSVAWEVAHDSEETEVLRDLTRVYRSRQAMAKALSVDRSTL